MIVYYTVIASLFLLAANDRLLSNNSKSSGERKPNIITRILMVTALFCVAGLRYNVGTDYYNYYASYDFFKTAPLSINDEPAIKIVARIAEQIYDAPGTMIFLAAAFTVILMTVTIIKNSDMYWFSIILYVFLGLWHGCFNGVRQYMAAAVLFAGHRFIKDKKFVPWCIVVFLATMCHVTAIIGILFYFYPKLKISVKNILISIIAALIGINLYDRIFDAISFLKSDSFDFEGVGSGYLLNSINPLRIIVAWVPITFFWIFRKYYNLTDGKFKFYMNMSMLHAVLMTTAMNSTYLGRVGIYTGIYNTITWPILLKKAEPTTKRALIVLMLLLYGVYWYVEASGETLAQFQWIFQR